jgi:hypothetical protein
MTDSEHIQADTRTGAGGQDDVMAGNVTTVCNGKMSLCGSIEAMRTSELLDVMVLDQRKAQTLLSLPDKRCDFTLKSERKMP